MKLTIYRDKWLRGGNGMSTLLSLASGRMCCMGFLARACGIKPGDPNDRHYFRYLASPDRKLLPEDLRPQHGDDTPLAKKIYDENDFVYTEKYRPATKEERLTELMKQAGIELVFEDHTPTETTP